MKKIYLLILAISLVAGTTFAQKTYLRLGVGGGVGLKQFMGYDWVDETETETTDDIVVKSMGLGGGFNANLAFGFMLSDNIGLELGINEGISLPKKSKYTYTNDNSNATEEWKISGMMLQVVPAIVITPALEKVNPYARIGMIIGVLPTGKEKFTGTYTGNENLKATHTAEYTTKVSGGIALGYSVAGGVSFNLGEKLAFYGELVFNGLTWAPSKGKYTAYTEDGIDRLPSMTTKEKEWTFEKKFDAAEEIPDGSPDKMPKNSVNLSNAGINIGIKFRF
jgi:hypothetical protein